MAGREHTVGTALDDRHHVRKRRAEQSVVAPHGAKRLGGRASPSPRRPGRRGGRHSASTRVSSGRACGRRTERRRQSCPLHRRSARSCCSLWSEMQKAHPPPAPLPSGQRPEAGWDERRRVDLPARMGEGRPNLGRAVLEHQHVADGTLSQEESVRSAHTGTRSAAWSLPRTPSVASWWAYRRPSQHCRRSVIAPGHLAAARSTGRGGKRGSGTRRSGSRHDRPRASPHRPVRPGRGGIRPPGRRRVSGDPGGRWRREPNRRSLGQDAAPDRGDGWQRGHGPIIQRDRARVQVIGDFPPVRSVPAYAPHVRLRRMNGRVASGFTVWRVAWSPRRRPRLPRCALSVRVTTVYDRSAGPTSRIALRMPRAYRQSPAPSTTTDSTRSSRSSLALPDAGVGWLAAPPRRPQPVRG